MYVLRIVNKDRILLKAN